MKKKYIIQKQVQAKRLFARFLVFVLALVVILIVVGGAASPAQRPVTGNICIIILVTFVLGGIVWIGMRTDIKCPSCGKSIQGGIHTPLALTTGKCGHCGNTIIEEEAEPSAAPLPSEGAPSEGR